MRPRLAGRLIALLGAYMLLTVTADLVNPIRLFQ